jgi:hypothetical protein
VPIAIRRTTHYSQKLALPGAFRCPWDSVTLDGSTSIGLIKTYYWTNIGGPAICSIQNDTASKTVARNLVPGVYIFELKVTDEKGGSSKASVQITVVKPDHSIKARIIEYGSGLPLGNVIVDVVAQPIAMILNQTDLNGEYSFFGTEVAFREFSKSGYWNARFYSDIEVNQFSPLVLFPSNIGIDYFSGQSFLCDSFLVKLFPVKFITIHLVDSHGLNSCLADCDVIFGVNGLFNQQGINYTVYETFANGIKIRLRPNIDTTFQYPVFGNTDNQFNVGQYDKDFGTVSQLYFKDTVFIANNGNQILNINY